ncbi:C1 family peptidase, partial [Aeromonas veronii]|uniref:C1 family peptidase n=1 Tax=Aeromonas veronii TaxID=654 RepID=UPI00406D37AD
MEASHPSLQFYSSGIYYEPNCSSKNLDHGVLLVGYGYEGTDANKSNYLFARNSWRGACVKGTLFYASPSSFT